MAAEQNADVDVAQFATDWRAWMFQMLARVRSGELPWMNADQIHRRVLDDVLDKHSALSLSKSERDNLNDVWHRLSSWPDAADAIQRLRGRYTTVVLTVLSWSIVVDCSKHNAIDWDGILSCEFLGHYKTDAEAYLTALRLLRAEPSQAMMVAAHTGDLRGAKAAGLHTAYVHREGESDVFPGSSDMLNRQPPISTWPRLTSLTSPTSSSPDRSGTDCLGARFSSYPRKRVSRLTL